MTTPTEVLDAVIVKALAAQQAWADDSWSGPPEPQSEAIVAECIAALGEAGFVIVTKVPTPEMLAAVCETYPRDTLDVLHHGLIKDWTAMLEAAPKS